MNQPKGKKGKPNLSVIDVEGTLRAAVDRHARNPNAPCPGKRWYDNLPPADQSKLQLGIDAILYAGCMATARRTYDTLVRQEMANRGEMDDGDEEGKMPHQQLGGNPSSSFEQGRGMNGNHGGMPPPGGYYPMHPSYGAANGDMMPPPPPPPRRSDRGSDSHRDGRERDHREHGRESSSMSRGDRERGVAAVAREAGNAAGVVGTVAAAPGAENATVVGEKAAAGGTRENAGGTTMAPLEGVDREAMMGGDVGADRGAMEGAGLGAGTVAGEKARGEGHGRDLGATGAEAVDDDIGLAPQIREGDAAGAARTTGIVLSSAMEGAGAEAVEEGAAGAAVDEEAAGALHQKRSVAGGTRTTAAIAGATMVGVGTEVLQ